METLKSIRLQLAAADEAWRARRTRDFVESLLFVHDLVDVTLSAFLADQCRALNLRIEEMAAVGLVTADLEELLQRARHDVSPLDALDILEQLDQALKERLDPSHKLLLRSNIFPRGKKTLLPFEPTDTLREIARKLKSRYAHQIEQHLKGKGADKVIAEAVDIFFYNSRVWDDPDEALLSEHLKVAELVQKEPRGVLWFPVLPGDSPILGDDDDDGGDMNDLLENFTIDTDVGQLQVEMQRLSERMVQPAEAAAADEGASSPSDVMPTPREESSASSRAHAILLRGEGTEREERIPLLGDLVSLGRGRENDIQILNDIKVSRFHCRILKENDTFFIEDNTSSNGTLVDGELISRRELLGGENVSIGNTVFRFLKE